MAGSVCGRQRREAARQIATIAFALGLASTAGAQTLTLRDAADTTLRGGSYANKNLSSGSVLETRASDDAEYKRRVLLKFDTHSTIPMGATVTSATLTMTVYGGNSATRTLSAYRETESYTETVATWNNRQSATRWATPGGTIAERVAQATVTATPGSRVTFDVTAMVRNVVKGTYSTSSRYARFVVMDAGSSSRDSWRQYYSEDSGTNGPTLTIVLGSSAASPPPPPPPPPPTLCTDCAASVSTLAELKTALADLTADTIRLTADIALSPTAILTITRSVKLIGRDMPPGRVQGKLLPDGTWKPTVTMPKFRGRIDIKANDVYLSGIEFVPNSHDVVIRSIYGFSRLTLDRVVVDGEDTGKVKRGLEANAADITVKESALVGIWKAEQDSQAIGGWNSPGPVRIINNWLEAGSENVMFGGASPVPSTIIATDVLIEANDLFKRPAWKAYARGAIGPDGRKRAMQVKNLIELKAARNVRILRNRLTGSWIDGQTGYGVLFTTRASGTTFPTAVVERVTFVKNEIRDVVAGMQIGGQDFNFVSRQGNTFLIQDNLWVLSGKKFLQMSHSPRNVVIDHNTIIHSANILGSIDRGSVKLADGTLTPAGPTLGFRFTNNLAINAIQASATNRNTYGLYAESPSFANCETCGGALLPDSVVTGNVLAGAAQSLNGNFYPAGNVFPTVAEFYAALYPVTYRIIGNAFASVSTDGTPVGRR
jgi:hypothetical protein